MVPVARVGSSTGLTRAIPCAATAASRARPRSVSSYMTIFPSRSERARPAAFSCRTWWETSRSSRPTIQARSQTQADSPASRASATASRVGSPSAFAPAAQSSSSSAVGSPSRDPLGLRQVEAEQIARLPREVRDSSYKHSYGYTNDCLADSENCIRRLRVRGAGWLMAPARRSPARHSSL